MTRLTVNPLRGRVEWPQKYSIVVIGDTQGYMSATYSGANAIDPTGTFNTEMKAMADWIIAQKGVHNIQAVLHVGDVTFANSLNYMQWTARSLFDPVIDAQIPFFAVPGNWDMGCNVPGDTVTAIAAYDAGNDRTLITGISTSDAPGRAVQAPSMNRYHIESISGSDVFVTGDASAESTGTWYRSSNNSRSRWTGPYNDFWSRSKIEHKPWFGDSYRETDATWDDPPATHQGTRFGLDNWYGTFSVGPRNYLVLCLEFGRDDFMLRWADTIVRRFPSHDLILLTHDYFGISVAVAGDIPHALDPGGITRSPDTPIYFGDVANQAVPGETMWDNYVCGWPNPRIITISGHHHSATIGPNKGFFPCGYLGPLAGGDTPTTDVIVDPASSWWGDNSVVRNGRFDGSSDWTAAGNWSIADGKATHTPGSTLTLSQTRVVTVGYDHETIYTVSDRTAGSVTIRLGTTGTGTARSANGTFTETIVAGGTASLFFVPSSDFDGSVSAVTVRRKGQLQPNGNPVWNINENRQAAPSGGDGIIVLLEFFPHKDTVRKTTFSVTTGEVFDGTITNNQYELFEFFYPMAGA